MKRGPGMPCVTAAGWAVGGASCKMLHFPGSGPQNHSSRRNTKNLHFQKSPSPPHGFLGHIKF